MNLFRPAAAWLLVLTFSVTGYAKVMPVEFDSGRNRLIAYMLSHQLPAQHFAHKSLDDISPAAFDLYLRQTDPRKRFFLQQDVDQMKAFTDRIDDELRRGRVVLPDTGTKLFNKRVGEVRIMTDKLLTKGFNPDREDYLELDTKKIEYARTTAELQDRWRRILKMQVLETYLDLLEQENKKIDSADKGEPEIKQPKLYLDGEFDKKLWSRSLDKVRDRNQLYLERLLQETRQEHYNRFFDTVARAFDPHTNYMAPTSKQDFDIHMSGSLEGIGALLREDEGQIKVVRIIPGSAAERQGDLQAEDVILSVAEKDEDSVDISAMRIREAVSYIRGPKGTEVILTVQRPDGSKKIIPIVRDVVQIEETYVKSEVLEDKHGNKVGYIKIPSFYRDFAAKGDRKKARNVTRDMFTELHKLKKKKIQGLVLDLRNNGGGSLADAVDITGLFLPGGPVVQVKNSQGEIKVLEDSDKNVFYSGPVIVLVNKFSASASEILAAALQDYDRALIIGGDHTHGKGTVQSLVDMNRNLPLLHRKKYDDLGALKVTIQKFYRINGESTQYKGIHPDIILPTILDYLKSGEKYQDYSLPWDTVDKVQYAQWDRDRFDLDEARRLTAKWLESSKDFKKIADRTEKARERSEHTKVPDYLEGVKKDHMELAALTDDDRNIQHMGSISNGRESDQNKKEPLIDQLKNDPFVQLSVHLMSELALAKKDHKVALD